jgi:hypothetical protein
MYQKPSSQNLLNDVIVASVGAGLVTTLAIGQGQHPLVAIAITFGSGIAAVILNRQL